MLKKIVLLLVCACVLGACSGRHVTVVDEGGFHTMAERIAPMLKARQILDEEGAYLTSSFAQELPANAGDLLFQRMSTAFRYQDSDPSVIARSFSASRRPGDSLEMRSNGFVLGQGIHMISVSLLGLADWNGDEVDDWFVRCTVRSILGDEERDYYLVVEDVNAPGMAPQLLAVYDCHSRRCTTYLQSGDKRAAPETAVIDMIPGQQAITAPPGSSSGTAEDPLGERKLGR